MKNIKFNYLKIIFLLGIVFSLAISCDRDISDDAVLAGFSTNGDIFIDGFTSGDLNYAPYSGSYLEAFTVDTDTKYSGNAGMRFDVLNEGDSDGAFSGAAFFLGTGRDLSNYDALTFWAKGSEARTINDIGFGQDFGQNRYETSLSGGLQLTTFWRKYTIPIPDASKLIEERGMFWYAEGSENGTGFTFWIDELQFEKLGTIAQGRPSILNGNNDTMQGFVGGILPLTGLTQTFNMASGQDQTVTIAPSYFNFTSSNPSVATVDEFGVVSIINSGTSVITATLNGIDATGSLTIESLGNFSLAPTPTRDPANVISVFSDFYTNAPVDFYNGYWQPWQTTESADFEINGDNILNYTNFNFVGTSFSNPTIDATVMSNLHINMYIPGDIPSNLDFLISLVNFGPDQVDGGGDDTRQQVFFNSSNFTANTWSTLEIPITLASRDNMGLIIYENVNGSSLDNFYLDNVYFYN